MGKIKDNTILGMPFLVRRQCKLSFKTKELEVDGGVLLCVNRDGDAEKYQVVVDRLTLLPVRTEKLIRGVIAGRVKQSQRLGTIEAATNRPQVAASIGCPDQHGAMWMRMLNPTDAELELGAGQEVGYFTELHQSQVTTFGPREKKNHLPPRFMS